MAFLFFCPFSLIVRINSPFVTPITNHQWLQLCQNLSGQVLGFCFGGGHLLLPCSGVEELCPGLELVVRKREFETSDREQQGKTRSRGYG